MSKNYPAKLGIEPLPIVDCVFEIYYSSSKPIVEFVPGLLRKELGEAVVVRQNSPIPIDVLKTLPADVNVGPALTLEYENCMIFVNFSSVTIGHKMPYAGWEQFRSQVSKILGILNQEKAFELINRCSVRYIDFFPLNDYNASLDMLDLDLKFQGEKITKAPISLEMIKQRESLINKVQIAYPIADQNDLGQKQGLLISVDTIKPFEPPCQSQYFFDNFTSISNEVHQECKKMFFDSLNPTTLEKLRPIYE